MPTRYERCLDTFEAFHHLAATLIYWRFIRRFCWTFLIAGQQGYVTMIGL
jgi:hypothetical protein